MQAPDFSLKGTDDEIHTLESYADKKALVVIFMCNHCPYVQAIVPRLNALADHFSDQNVAFIGINSNDTKKYPDDSFINMKKLPLAFDYLFDETQEVAKAYKAVCTPDIYVFDENRALQYHGRLDDNWQDEAAVTKHELREAIEKVKNGDSISAEEQVASMGCGIKWKE